MRKLIFFLSTVGLVEDGNVSVVLNFRSPPPSVVANRRSSPPGLGEGEGLDLGESADSRDAEAEVEGDDGLQDLTVLVEVLSQGLFGNLPRQPSDKDFG
ncbi:hypothetical protein ACFX2J_027029 [Malus domestica]